MKIASVLLLLTLVLFAFQSTSEARIAPLRVVFVSGSKEYESDKTMPILKKYFESKYPSIVTIINAKSQKDLPGLEALEKCDVAVFYTRRLEIDGEQLERVKKYCTSGKPIVGIRTASHGFQKWLDKDKDIWGGNYKGHYNVGPVCEVQFLERKKETPILDGVKPFKSKGSLYRNTGLAKDVDILLNGSIPDHTEPIAWTRLVKNTRVFYTSLGAQSDFEDENFLRLMTNGILWAAERAPRKK
jgi:type 1 glutamine amidotransferase